MRQARGAGEAPPRDHAVLTATPDARVWMERVALGLVAALYLVIFQADVPNGDGRVYIRQIEAGTFLWNPNHLLTQPIGLLFVRLVQGLGLPLGTFGALKLLSGISSVVALLLFHAALGTAGIGPRLLRIAIALCLFFSAHFLSMGIAEEYYMVQMPVLLLAFALGVRWALAPAAPGARRRLAAMGILAAIATGIAINNGPLVLALGIVAGLAGRTGRDSIVDALAVWIPAALVGLPLFVLPYLADAPDATFIQWLVNYQGTAANPTDALYGLKLTPSGIVVSLVTLAYGSVSSVVSLRQVGAVAEGVASRQPLEFIPDPGGVALTVLLVLAVLVLVAPLLVRGLWRGRADLLVRFCVAWTAAYLLFNFLWVDTSDQFYFQVLPAVWLVVGLAAVPLGGPGRLAVSPRWSVALVALVVVMAGANTAGVVLPRAGADVERRSTMLQGLLRDGDLVITPGWDDLLWIAVDEGRAQERVLLMELALNTPRQDATLGGLPDRIAAHLASGRRVVVLRLFDRDRENRPWEDLARLRWPRSRLIALLGGFEARELGRVDDVVVRELKASGADAAGPASTGTGGADAS